MKYILFSLMLMTARPALAADKICSISFQDTSRDSAQFDTFSAVIDSRWKKVSLSSDNYIFGENPFVKLSLVSKKDGKLVFEGTHNFNGEKIEYTFTADRNDDEYSFQTTERGKRNLGSVSCR